MANLHNLGSNSELRALRFEMFSCWFWHFFVCVWTWFPPLIFLAMMLCATGCVSFFKVFLGCALVWRLPILAWSMTWGVWTGLVMMIWLTVGIRLTRIRWFRFWTAFTNRSRLMINTTHYIQQSVGNVTWHSINFFFYFWWLTLSPLDLFLPIPSLSTTSLLHLMWRPGLLISEGAALFSPLSLNVPELWTVDWSSGPWRTWEPDAAGDDTWRARDIIHKPIVDKSRLVWLYI